MRIKNRFSNLRKPLYFLFSFSFICGSASLSKQDLENIRRFKQELFQKDNNITASQDNEIQNNLYSETKNSMVTAKVPATPEVVSAPDVSIPALSAPPMVYEAAERQGQIGVFSEDEEDGIEDNFFTIQLPAHPTTGNSAYLVYDLYGLANHQSVPRSINRNPAIGGDVITASYQWATQKEEINPALLKSGKNTIHFTAPVQGIKYKIKNVKILFEPTAQPQQELSLSSVLSGDRLYVKGFLRNAAGDETVFFGDEALTLPYGEFEKTLPVSEQMKSSGQLSVRTKTTAVTHSFKGTQEKSRQVNQKEFKTHFFNIAQQPEQYFQYEGAGVEITDHTAVAGSILGISKLRSKDFPGMQHSIKNITPDGSAYRIGIPSGVSQQKIRVTLPYDAKRLGTLSAKEIKIFYFDYTSKKWKIAGAAKVDEQKQTVSVESTGESQDYINGIISVPESPQLNAFAPTSISGLKAADPTAGLQFIAPPTPSQKGDANLSYPIVVPQGTGGLQPNLSISYNSGAGNGWMGEGWDISGLSSISVDTRWGSPEFDPQYETELYSLDGEMLVYEGEYMPHRHHDVGGSMSISKQSRGPGTKNFYLRRNHDFAKIERTGSSPVTYQWRITQTDGTISVYSQVLASSSGISKWALRSVEDVHGNVMNFNYDQNNAGHISSISYGKDASYSVIFQRETAVSRPDVRMDAKLGVTVTESYRLTKILVMYKSEIIRTYELQYETGRFSKTLLKQIKVTPLTDTTSTNDYVFDYYDDLVTAGGSVSDYTEDHIVPVHPSVYSFNMNIVPAGMSPSKINSNSIFENGKNMRIPSVGVDVYIPNQDPYGHFIIGYNYGNSNAKSHNMQQIIDFNGDGIIDIIYRKHNDGLWVLPGALDSNGRICFNIGCTTPFKIKNYDSEFSFTETKTQNRGYDAGIGYAGVGFNISQMWSTTNSTTSVFLTDANSDGLPDIVSNGEVWFNKANGNSIDMTRLSEFTENMVLKSNMNIFPPDSSVPPPPIPINGPPVAQNDVVRVWIAPKDGNIMIRDNISVENIPNAQAVYSIEVLNPSVPNYGVNRRVYLKRIFQGNSENIIIRRYNDYYQQIKAMPPFHAEDHWGINNSSMLYVKSGDKVYFRLHKNGDDNFKVQSNPHVSYVDNSGFEIFPNKTMRHNDFHLNNGSYSENYLLNNIYTPVKLDGTGQATITIPSVTFQKTYDKILFTANIIDINTGTSTPLIPAEEYLQSSVPFSTNSHVITLAVNQSSPVRLEFSVKSDSHTDFSDSNWNNITVDFNGTAGAGANTYSFSQNYKAIPAYPSYAVSKFTGQLNIADYLTTIPTGIHQYGVQINKALPSFSGLINGSFFYIVRKGDEIIGKRKVYVNVLSGQITEEDMMTGQGVPGIQPLHYYGGDLQYPIPYSQFLSIQVYCTNDHDYKLYSAYSNALNGKPFNVYYWNLTSPYQVLDPIQPSSVNSAVYNLKTLIYRNYGQFLYDQASDIIREGDLGPDAFVYNPQTPEDEYGRLINNDYFAENGYFTEMYFPACYGASDIEQCIIGQLTQTFQYPANFISPISPLRTHKAGNVEKWIGIDTEQYSMRNSFKDDESIVTSIIPNPVSNAPNLPPTTFTSPLFSLSSEMKAINVKHYSRNKTTTLSGSVIVAGFGNSESHLVDEGNIQLQDFRDMNGDGYPDMVYKENMVLTNALGGHKPIAQSSYIDEYLTDTYSFQRSNSASYSHNSFKTAGRGMAHGYDGTTTTADTSTPWAGAGGAISVYDADTKDYGKGFWLDINGDGLPDRVMADDEYTEITYRLNLGKMLSPATQTFNNGYTYLSSPVGSASVSFPLGSLAQNIDFGAIGSLGFGVSASFGLSSSLGSGKRIFEDINGDGLVDLLTIQNNSTEVQYNLGKSFAPPVPLYKSQHGVNFNNETATYNGSFSFSGHLYIPVGPIPIFPPIPVVILWAKGGIGGTLNAGMAISETNKTFRDMNGDGYPDLVEKSGNGFKVNYSRIGRTNKLKTVTNTASGGVYTIDYELKRATYANPHAKYVMSKVEILNPDAFSGTYTQSNPNKNMVTQFQYENPKYDRRERADFGFSSVTTNEMNGSDIYRVTKNTYYNNSYLLHGLLIKSEIMDGSGVLKRETKNEYTLRKFNSDVTEIDQSIALPSNYDTGGKEGRKMATALLTKTTTQDIENGQSITKTARFGYTEKGLINSYIYSSPSTTYNSRITYHALGNNIISIPASIKVYPGSVPGTHPLRERVTLVNTSNGDVLKIKVRLQGNQYAETDFTYDVYGNMLSVEYPPNENGQRVKLHYIYNTETKNFVTKVTDQSGMSSSAVYDYVLGLPLETTDITGNKMYYDYDSRGRVTKILAPKEYNTGRDNPYTIKYEYGFIPHGNNQLYYAKTQNFDAQHPDNPIEILTIADFMGRVIQVKKDIDLDGAEKISVGGRTEYDLLGRAIKQYHPDQEDPGIMALSPVNGVPYTTAEYDVLNRTVRTTDADGIATLTTYSIESGQYKTTVNVSNMKTETFSNGEGKPALIKNYLNNTPLSTIFSYNTLGELMHVTDPENLTTTYEYDLAGRRTFMNHPDRGETTYEYDDAGNLVRYRSPNLVNNPTNADFIHYLYEYNRLVNIMLPDLPSGDPNPNNVRYEYAPDGNGNNTGKLVYKQDGTGTVQYEYGNMGELVSEHRTVIGINIMPTHYNTHFSYDSFNRIQEIIYPDGEGVSYFYNYGGNLHQVNSSLGDTYIKAIVYDKYEQRSRVSYGNGAQTLFHYTPGNRRLSEYELSINGQSLLNNTYLYDNVGNITYLSNAAGPSPNEMGGVYDFNYHYDTLNRLQYSHGKFRIEETHTEPPQSIPGWSPYQVSNSTFSLNLEYNSAGGILNKIQHHEQDVQVNEHNTYDHQYNYIDGTHKINIIFDPNSGISEYFDYDLNGNMTYRENDDTGYEHLYWDEQDRLKAFHHPERAIFQYYAYDDKGERTLKYNMLGDAQLYHNGTLVDPGSLAQSGAKIYPNPYVVVNVEENYTKHYFDGSTRFASRVEEDPNVFNQTSRPQKAGKNTIVDPNADLKRYLEKAGLTEKVEKEFAKAPVSPGLYYLHTDHLGTATYVTNSNGDTSQFFLNLPFGETMAEQNLPGEYENPYKFNAKELDTETELYYYGARYYNPRLSVWYGVDPLAEEFPSWSPYVYTFNNPIRYIDPTGMAPEHIDVTKNEDGTYKVVGGQANSDKNIYVVDASGKRTGEVVGQMLTGYSFHDEKGNAVVGANINLSDQSGQNFFNNEIKNVGLIEYMGNAKGGEPLDFKTRDMPKGLTNEAKDQYVYRGMSFEGKVASARDIGNYAAGYVAGVHGFGWGSSRFAFDALQTKQEKGTWNTVLWYPFNRVREGQPTQQAQRAGHNVGYPIFKQRQFEREWRKATNPYPIGPK